MARANSSGSRYIGRFAPSPTGPLHFGSLLAGLASYLDAKSQDGIWLMRMEDLDPPREPPGTADFILNQLLELGLEWDGPVLYQSTRLDEYQRVMDQLQERELCFFCDCTRPRIRSLGSVYDGHCQERGLKSSSETAVRLKVDNSAISFTDAVQGIYSQNLINEVGDFVIQRKDGLFAYQLAVVVDDAYQGITHIVRGYDLLDSTPRQIHIQRLMGYSTPNYAHIPIIVNEQGQKLSKQHFAESIDTANAAAQIFSALQFLNQNPPQTLKRDSCKSILEWAISSWDIQAVPKLANMPLCSEH